MKGLRKLTASAKSPRSNRAVHLETSPPPLSSKHVTPTSIWASSKTKLLVYVRKAKDLLNYDHGSAFARGGRILVKISIPGVEKESSFKKLVPVVSGTAEFDQFFFFGLDGVLATGDIGVEVYAEAAKTKHAPMMLGSASLMPIDALAREVVMDSTITLVSASSGSKSGTLSLRFLLSDSMEAAGPPQNQFFYYRDIKKAHRIRTGDLLLYSEPGLESATLRLMHNSIHNRAGLVVVLPNKYTQEDKLYIFDVGKNLDAYPDAFVEKPRYTTSLFRLYERIHHVPGNEVLWCPLKQDLGENLKHNMIQWLLKLHRDKINIGSLFNLPLPSCFRDLMKVLGVDGYNGSEQKDFDINFHSSNVLIEALRIGGLRIDSNSDFAFVNDIVNSGHYLDPVVVRSSFPRSTSQLPVFTEQEEKDHLKRLEGDRRNEIMRLENMKVEAERKEKEAIDIMKREEERRQQVEMEAARNLKARQARSRGNETKRHTTGCTREDIIREALSTNLPVFSESANSHKANDTRPPIPPRPRRKSNPPPLPPKSRSSSKAPSVATKNFPKASSNPFSEFDTPTEVNASDASPRGPSVDTADSDPNPFSEFGVQQYPEKTEITEESIPSVDTLIEQFLSSPESPTSDRDSWNDVELEYDVAEVEQEVPEERKRSLWIPSSLDETVD